MISGEDDIVDSKYWWRCWCWLRWCWYILSTGCLLFENYSKFIREYFHHQGLCFARQQWLWGIDWKPLCLSSCIFTLWSYSLFIVELSIFLFYQIKLSNRRRCHSDIQRKFSAKGKFSLLIILSTTSYLHMLGLDAFFLTKYVARSSWGISVEKN